MGRRDDRGARTIARSARGDRTEPAHAAGPRRAPLTAPTAVPGSVPGAQASRRPRSRRPLVLQLLVVLPLAALPRISAAVSDHGILWPDEIYQTTEQGHRLAFGYGFVPWEFSEGLRSWALPAGIGAVMRSASAAGADSGLALMTAVKLALALIGVAAVAAAMMLAWRVGGPTASLLAGALTAAFPMLLVYGGHPFAETVSAPLVVVAAVLALGTTRRSHAAAGVAAALAAVVRPHNLVLAAGIAVLLVRHNPAGARRYAAAAGTVVALSGGVDWLTWGAPFASWWRYVDFNLVDGGARAFGTSSPGYYVRHLVTSSGPAIVLVAAGLAVAARRQLALVATVAAFVALHSVVGHKELRFILPVVPLALALAGAGLGRVADDVFARWGSARRGAAPVWTRPVVLAVAVVVPAAFAVAAGYETLGRLGERRADLAATSPWHHVESWNRLLSAAGGRPGLCGVGVAPLHVVFTGGYSYLHRDVPLFNVNQYALQAGEPPDGGANHLIVPTDYPVPAGFREVAREGPTRLLARPGGCDAPPPTYRRWWPRPPEVLRLVP